MPGLGAATVVVKEGQVLLIMREDFRLWGLPGGTVEDGESVSEAAIREVREETGLVVALTRLVGLYSRPQWFGGNHLAIFVGHAIGGTLRPDPREALDARFFAPTNLPEHLLWWHRPIIADALAGIGGSCATRLDVLWPFDLGTSRADIYKLRDEGGIAPEDLARLWQHPGPDAERREVEGNVNSEG